MPSDTHIVSGMMAWYEGRRVIVKAIVDLETVLVADAETNERRKASVHDLRLSAPTPKVGTGSDSDSLRPDLLYIPEESLDIAKARYEAIAPLLNDPGRSYAKVLARAKEVGVGKTALYDWLRAYEETGVLTSLLRRGRSDKGRPRISGPVEEIIETHLEKRFLTGQKLSVTTVADEIRGACQASGLPLPHFKTILARINSIPEYARAKKREGRDAARQLEPSEGSLPGADWPLAIVEMDHTPMDIELVDDVSRQPIGRPFITLAIDVYSRIVMGFYITLDPPSALSVSMCLAQAMLPKDEIVSRAGCENAWPIWGKIGTLHVDNAKEFRSKALTMACTEYGIDIQWRPVLRPNYGGHVERMMGTLGTVLHTLPGTTFSNVEKKGEYDSGKTAVFTLAELDTWVTQFLVDIYHQRKHSTLDKPPIKRLQEGLMGDGKTRGRGLIPVPADAQRLRLDFMPYIERTIQREGVSIDDITYYDPVLRPWVKAKDPGDKDKTRLFIFRRDPRDISRLYFYDPDLKEYFVIPYRDRSRPAMSIWDLRAAKKLAKQEQKGMVDEEAIFRANRRLRSLEERAAEDTRKTRRSAQRRRLHGQAQADVAAAAVSSSQGPPDEGINPMEKLPPAVPFDDLAFGDEV